MAKMTVARLHKQLGEMVQSGQGWMQVCVYKPSFSRPLESEGADVLDVKSGAHEWIPLCGDNGSIAVRADGTERGSMCFVLYGGARMI